MGGKKFSLWLFLFSLALFVWLFSIFLKSFIVATLLVLATVEFSKKCDMFFENSKYETVKSQTKLLSASVLTLFFGVIMFLPTGYFIIYIINDTIHFDLSHISELKPKLEAFAANTEILNGYMKEKVALWINDLFSEQFWNTEAKNIFGAVGDFAKQIASSLAELVMIVIFFFLLHLFKSDIVSFIKPLIPLEEHKKELLTRETISAISVVFVMLLGIMVAQGVAFFALMLFFDYDALALGFFSALSSIVPIFGTALVWVPIAVSEAMKGNIVGALVIAAYSWFVMAFLIDNFVRLYLLNKATKILKTEYKINEFLLFFSIAAGIASFGFWGVIIGPSVTALFISSAKLYKNDVL
jgi:predicted PurR-regulated permease PerM